jgi:predicted kinase
MLIVLSGLPGSGKSTLAERLAVHLRAPVLSVDPIESAMLEAGIEQSFATGIAAYNVARACADQFLATGLDVIVDAVNAVAPARDAWRALAERHDVSLRVVQCVLDPDEASRRLSRRSRGLAMGEPSAWDLRERGREWTPWPEAHLTLDAADGLESNVRTALAWIRASVP